MRNDRQHSAFSTQPSVRKGLYLWPPLASAGGALGFRGLCARGFTGLSGYLQPRRNWLGVTLADSSQLGQFLFQFEHGRKQVTHFPDPLEDLVRFEDQQ